LVQGRKQPKEDSLRRQAVLVKILGIASPTEQITRHHERQDRNITVISKQNKYVQQDICTEGIGLPSHRAS
jgi:hypothetical protein